jgi:hypothetical protein
VGVVPAIPAGEARREKGFLRELQGRTNDIPHPVWRAVGLEGAVDDTATSHDVLSFGNAHRHSRLVLFGVASVCELRTGKRRKATVALAEVFAEDFR